MTLAAVPLTQIPAADLLHFLLPGLFVTAFTVTVGVAGGVLLSRAQPRHISPETGVLSMLPGGASVVSTLAIDFGAKLRHAHAVFAGAGVIADAAGDRASVYEWAAARGGFKQR